MTLYLDSNVFIYATLNNEECGRKARALLERIRRGDNQGLTSALTIDEIIWSVKKHRNFEDALDAGGAFLNFPNLDLIPVTDELVASAMTLMKNYHIDPRDAIHAATAIKTKAECIVSTDQHFDRVKELTRKPL